MSVTDCDIDQINAYFSGNNAEELTKFCSFWVCNRLFGIDIKDIREINKVSNVSKVFHAPESVHGYVNIRGQIHLILDLKNLLGLHKDNDEEDSEELTLVVFKDSVGDPFGIVIDEIGGVIEVEQSRIEYHQSEDDSFAQDVLIDGVCKLEHDLLMVLDAHSFLKQIGK
ncbi:chemotaxis protein CheW [bacterium]|nr:chemotaxis protein CheW [bacterium]